MKQVLKSRTFLQAYNSAASLRGAMDCGECMTTREIAPMVRHAQPWFPEFNANERKILKKLAWQLAGMFIFSQMGYFLIRSVA